MIERAGYFILAFCLMPGSLGAVEAGSWRFPAAHVDKARRDTMGSPIRIAGSFVPHGLHRIKSTISGRVELLGDSSFTWMTPDRPLGFVADTELAALIDAEGLQAGDLLMERWRRHYRPLVIRCLAPCFIRRISVKHREPVLPNALLFETARGLRMTGRVPIEQADLLRDGDEFEYWPVSEPALKRRARIANYTVDRTTDAGREVGGNFWIEIPPDGNRYPGSHWEGRASSEMKQDLLSVPSAAVIEHAGKSYIAVPVSTGAVWGGYTEVTGGIEEGVRVLALSPNLPELPEGFKESRGSWGWRAPPREKEFGLEDFDSLTARYPPETVMALCCKGEDEADIFWKLRPYEEAESGPAVARRGMRGYLAVYGVSSTFSNYRSGEFSSLAIYGPSSTFSYYQVGAPDPRYPVQSRAGFRTGVWTKHLGAAFDYSSVAVAGPAVSATDGPLTVVSKSSLDADLYTLSIFARPALDWLHPYTGIGLSIMPWKETTASTDIIALLGINFSYYSVQKETAVAGVIPWGIAVSPPGFPLSLFAEGRYFFPKGDSGTWSQGARISFQWLFGTAYNF